MPSTQYKSDRLLSYPNSDRQVARRMTSRWLSGLLLLAGLTLGGFWLFSRQMTALDVSASLINEAGRQRMLSQRAALLARRLEETAAGSERQQLRAEILEIAGSMESTRSTLFGRSTAAGGTGELPASLEPIFTGPPYFLDRECREFVAAAVALGTEEPLDRTALNLLVSKAEERTFLDALDAVAAELERHGEASVARFQRALAIVTVLALGAMLILGLAVFRPMVQDTQRILRRLREQSEIQRLTVDSALTSIAAVDVEGRLVRVNRFLCGLTGFEGQELVGRSLASLVHPEDRGSSGELLQSALDGDEPPPARTIRLITASGEERRGLCRYGAQHDEDGAPVLVVVHFEDLTERFAAEEDARRSRERLVHVSRVTAMGEMAGGIAHEVNQPLTAIATYAQACRRLGAAGRLRSPELLRTLDKINEQARRAGEVIRRLRDFVRRQDTGAEVVDLNAVVGEAVGLAGTDARVKDCAIETRLEPGLEPVVADPIQLQQVVLNLIRNGLEAQAACGAADPIVVSTSAVGEDAVQVAVSDRGQGLPDDPEELFEPFFTTKSSGMGIGLAISRRIIAAQGGCIWCAPNEGGGAVFLFSLPTAVAGRRRMTG